MNTICNICKNKNVKFVDTELHLGVKCSICNSQVRHRLLYEVIKLYLYKNKSILHFSPHKELSRILSNEVDNYFHPILSYYSSAQQNLQNACPKRW